MPESSSHLIWFLLTLSPSVTNHSERAQNLFPRSDQAAGWAAFRDIVFRSPTLPFLGRRTEEYGLSDRQSPAGADITTLNCNGLVRSHELRRHVATRVLYQIT